MDIGSLVADLKLDMSQFNNGIERAQSKMKSAGKKMQSTGKQMSMAVSLPAGIAGGLAVTKFANFEAAMNQVKAVSQATSGQMQRMEEVTRKLGSSTKFSATQAAEGMNFLSMAGFNVEESIKALPSTLNLAAAGNMQLGESADIVSNVMQGFGRNASKTGETVDILTKTFTNSNTSLKQLGDAMSYAAPVAKAFGQDVTETSAAVGILSDAGIQASKAGTGLRQTFMQLQKKSDQLGISVKDSQDNMKSLSELLAAIEEQGMETSKVIDIVGAGAGTALSALLDRGSGALKEFTSELSDAGGTAEQVADTQMEGLKGAFTELMSALNELAISFVKPLSDMLEGLVDRIKGMVNWLSDLSPVAKRIVTVFGAIVAASGPLLTVFGFLMTNVIPGLVTRIGRLIVSLKTLWVAMMSNPITTVIAPLKTLWVAMMSNPITAVIAGIAALATAVYVFSNRTKEATFDQGRLNEAVGKATDDMRKEKAELQVLSDRLETNSQKLKQQKQALKQAEEGTTEYQVISENLKQTEEKREELIDKLNKKYGDYLDTQLSTSDSYETIKKKIENVNTQLKEKIKLKAKEAKAEAMFEQMVEVQKKIGNLERENKNITKESAFAELNIWDKVVKGLGAFFSQKSNLQKTALETARVYNKEELNDLKETKSQMMEQYKNLQKEIDNMDFSLDTDDGDGDGKAYAQSFSKAAKQNLPTSLGIEMKPPDPSDMEFAGAMAKDTFLPPGMTQAWQNMQNSIKQAQKEYQVFGNKSDLISQKQRALKTAIQNLLEQGYKPTNEEILKLKQRYDNLNQTQNKAKQGFIDLGAVSKEIFTGMQNSLQKALDEGKNILDSFTNFFIDMLKSLIIKLTTAAAAAFALSLLLGGTGVISGVGALGSGGFKSAFGMMSGLQGMASGGIVTQGGMFEVGERGPETAMLPKGSAVIPNQNKDGGKNENLVAQVSGDQLNFILERNKRKNQRLGKT